MADDPWKSIENRQQDRPRHTIPINRIGIRSMSQQRPPNMFNTTTINSTGLDQPPTREVHDVLLNQCRGNDFFDTRQTVSRYYYARRNVIQLLREFLRKNSSVLGSINSDCYNTLMTSMRMMLEETIPHINNLMSEYYGEKLELETRDETQDKIWQIVTAGVNVDELVLIIAALHGTKMGKTLDDVYISQAKIHASSRIAEVRHSYTGDSINSPELWKTATMKQLEMYEKGSDFEITRKSPTIFEQRKSIRSRHARSEDMNLPPIYPKGRSLSEGLLFMRTKYVPKDPNSTTQSKV